MGGVDIAEFTIGGGVDLRLRCRTEVDAPCARRYHSQTERNFKETKNISTRELLM